MATPGNNWDGKISIWIALLLALPTGGLSILYYIYQDDD